MTKAVPMVCPVCIRRPGAYYGRLVFPDELLPSAPDVPRCPNHPKGHEQPLEIA